MLACPYCGNILLVDGTGSPTTLFCLTCAYRSPVWQPLVSEVALRPKRLEPVISDDMWRTAERNATMICPSCGHEGAYFYQLQTRSADEAMTVFYRCEACDNRWRET